MKNFKQVVIYYFSGTGNAKTVANWITESFVNSNYEVTCIDIGSLKNRKSVEVPKNAIIGLCSPTHGFNFPPIVLNFIFRFKRTKQNQIFLINTRAGLKLGKYFIPGLSGIALIFSSLLLKIKGYKLIGLRSIDLPSNWISLHPGLKSKVIDSLFEKRKLDTIDFANKLINGQTDFRALRDLIQDMLVAPIAILYYLIGRFVLAKSFIASNDCNQCNKCVEQCPVNAIKVIDQRCFWTCKCESCMHCMNICPKRAIETTHGFIIGLSVLFNSVILIGIYKLINFEKLLSNYLSVHISKMILFCLDSFIFLALLILAYRIVHYLLKFRWFEKFIVATSLTHYQFWRRYKGQKKEAS